MASLKTTDPLSQHFTDLGNARRLVSRYGHDLRYCYAWDKWLIWNGVSWGKDESGEVFRRAKDTILSIYEEAKDIENDTDRRVMVKHALESERLGHLTALIALAKSEPGIPVTVKELDANLWLLNCPNGTIDLHTGKLHTHRRSDLITKLVPTPYNPEAKCPLWDAVLDKIMGGNKELIGFLQRAVGYALTGDTSEQCLFLLYGTGANGKTTFLETIRACLGDYALVADSSTFLTQKGNHVRNDIARLAGARFVAAVEVESGRKLAEVLVKNITGCDTVTARFLYCEPFEFCPTFKVFLCTNHKPEIQGSDYAIWRRIRLIPFTVTILLKERDKELPEKLRVELPGILAWAVRGCMQWQQEGMGTPEEVKKATNEYKREMDDLSGFIANRCVVDPAGRVSAKDLYTAYVRWCDQNAEDPLSKRTFEIKIGERGFTSSYVNNVRFRIGLKLR